MYRLMAGKTTDPRGVQTLDNQRGRSVVIVACGAVVASGGRERLRWIGRREYCPLHDRRVQHPYGAVLFDGSHGYSAAAGE
jgi:hypothetical protein